MISGVGLGTLYLYTCGLTVLSGFNSVVATLVSQSYGQHDLRLCGIYLNRGRIVALASCIPITLMMLLSGYVLRAFSFDEGCVYHASRFTKLMIPMIFFQS